MIEESNLKNPRKYKSTSTIKYKSRNKNGSKNKNRDANLDCKYLNILNTILVSSEKRSPYLCHSRSYRN